MNWIENANSIVCLLLLVYLLPVAAVVGKGLHKTSVSLMAVALGLQLMGPMFGWIPEMGWPSAILNLTILAVVTAWRKPLWSMVNEFK